MPIRKTVRRPWIPKTAKKKAQTGRKEPTNFYHSSRWRKTRAAYISAHPLCEECRKKGKITPGRVVDHITPIRQGGEETDWENLQTLCDSCHNKKSGKERWTQNQQP